MIFILISFLLIISYAILIGSITIGWYRLKKFQNILPDPKVKVSIVGAARNEASNIEALLKSLSQQDYP